MNKKYAKSFMSMKEATRYVGYFTASQEAEVVKIGSGFAVYAYTPEMVNKLKNSSIQVIEEIISTIKKAA